LYDLIKYREHQKELLNLKELDLGIEKYEYTFPKKRNPNSNKCIDIYRTSEGHKIELSYFIGVDWISPNQAIYVQPKLNKDESQTNYLKMLFDALKHPEAVNCIDDLFVIKFDKEYIEIEQKDDLLTPLLVIQFLQIIKKIVKKGLKKSYYRVEQNLNSKVKGKILVSQTIKQNQIKNKPLYTYCTYDEFGFNGLENRLLKKTLLFVKRFLPSLKLMNADKYSADVFNYIMPAFEFVSDDVNMHEIIHSKTNVFYKEYEDAIKLAKLILKRFGYNITNTEQEGKIKTPPFWIDMALLFELYVLGLLKEKYNSAITFQFNGNRSYLDFLLKTKDKKIIIDAKYKPQYINNYEPDDIRQLSGYSRDKSVLRELEINKEDYKNTVIECLIIYPDRNYLTNGEKENIDIASKQEIEQFNEFYKLSVKLPMI
jgi:5-methylcytosine-specific restriction enzyme subunit McrC